MKNGVMMQYLDNTLLKSHPELAVTFVNNHDFQSGSALEGAQVKDWFY